MPWSASSGRGRIWKSWVQLAGGSTTIEFESASHASPRQVPPPGTIMNVDTGDPGDLRHKVATSSLRGMPMHRRAHAGLTSDKHITRVRHARGAGAPSMPQIFRPGPRLPAALSTCLFVYTVPTRNVQRGSWVIRSVLWREACLDSDGCRFVHSP